MEYFKFSKNFQLPTTNYQLPITNYQLTATNFHRHHRQNLLQTIHLQKSHHPKNFLMVSLPNWIVLILCCWKRILKKHVNPFLLSFENRCTNWAGGCLTLQIFSPISPVIQRLGHSSLCFQNNGDRLEAAFSVCFLPLLR